VDLQLVLLGETTLDQQFADVFSLVTLQKRQDSLKKDRKRKLF
jgi:hypothetical protein